MKKLLDNQQLDITLRRLAHELIENHLDFSETVIIGLQPRGILLSDRLIALLKSITQNEDLLYGKLDFTFYRDDVHQNADMQVPSQTDIPFSVEGKKVVLIDDVLHTGRTVRAALDALLGFGRPKNVELLVLVDRHYSRELPIQADYIGMTVDTIISQKVKVNWKEKDKKDEVLLID